MGGGLYGCVDLRETSAGDVNKVGPKTGVVVVPVPVPEPCSPSIAVSPLLPDVIIMAQL